MSPRVRCASLRKITKHTLDVDCAPRPAPGHPHSGLCHRLVTRTKIAGSVAGACSPQWNIGTAVAEPAPASNVGDERCSHSARAVSDLCRQHASVVSFKHALVKAWCSVAVCNSPTMGSRIVECGTPPAGCPPSCSQHYCGVPCAPQADPTPVILRFPCISVCSEVSLFQPLGSLCPAAGFRLQEYEPHLLALSFRAVWIHCRTPVSHYNAVNEVDRRILQAKKCDETVPLRRSIIRSLARCWLVCAECLESAAWNLCIGRTGQWYKQAMPQHGPGECGPCRTGEQNRRGWWGKRVDGSTICPQRDREGQPPALHISRCWRSAPHG